MKELSIEQKAKRYDEALAKARQIHSEGKAQCADVMTKVFPELKESEDERIKRLIIKHFKEISKKNEQSWRNLDIPYILAWLEKQGEPSIKWNENTEGNKPPINHSILMKTTHGIAEGEWKGEYWYQYRWAARVKDSDVLSWIELSDSDNQGEQNPAEWHREDEQNLNACLSYILDEYLRRWLKDIIHANYDKPTDKVEPKSSWSEEDENSLSNVLWCCKKAASIAKDENEMGTVWCAERWLKSLKDRCIWKPTKEQIDAIRLARSFVVDDFSDKPSLSETLLKLEEQMKKVMEG